MSGGGLLLIGGGGGVEIPPLSSPALFHLGVAGGR